MEKSVVCLGRVQWVECESTTNAVRRPVSRTKFMKRLRFCFVLLLLAAFSANAAKVLLVAGGGTLDEGKATDVKLSAPFGAAFDSHGNLFLVEMTGERVRQIDPRGMLKTVAGTGVKGFVGDEGPATNAQFNGIHNLAILPNGDVLLADTWNNRMRQIAVADGTIKTIAGTGTKGFSGDGGPALQAEFGGIYCASLDPKGQLLYLADLDNRRIRKIDLQFGLVTTIAGNGKAGVPRDGAQAIASPLVDPRAVCADNQGNVYILERGGHALRVVNSNGQIRTVVGTGKKGFSGDGGDALQATLNGPKHLCMDLQGNVLIADTENHVIRKFIPKEGKIVRVAGSGKKGRGGLNGAPEDLELNQPHGVYVHPSGDLYISDSSNNRVLKIVDQ